MVNETTKSNEQNATPTTASEPKPAEAKRIETTRMKPIVTTAPLSAPTPPLPEHLTQPAPAKPLTTPVVDQPVVRSDRIQVGDHVDYLGYYYTVTGFRPNGVAEMKLLNGPQRETYQAMISKLKRIG